MTIKDLIPVILSDVTVVSDKGNGVYVIHFEGDLAHPELDPEVASREVEVVQAIKLGKIRIIVK